MIKGMYHHSEETKDKISKALKGRHVSEETKIKMSEVAIGNKNRLGHYHSKETKERMSAVKKGKKRIPFSIEHRRKLSESAKGKIISKETREKISEANKGHVGYYKNKHHSKKTKLKISNSLKGKYTGEKCPNWKGGITPLTHLIRCSFKYRQWRDDIYTRDNFICQECGQCGGKLHAHHIKRFSSIIQYYEITTLEEALECDELWNINNGITLCEDCHKKTNNYKNKRIKLICLS